MTFNTAARRGQLTLEGHHNVVFAVVLIQNRVLYFLGHFKVLFSSSWFFSGISAPARFIRFLKREEKSVYERRSADISCRKRCVATHVTHNADIYIYIYQN